MATPIVTALQPPRGPSGGGDLVRLVGVGFAPTLRVLFDGVPGDVITVRDEAGISLADVRTRAHAPADVDVLVQNLDATGAPVAGETALAAAAYRFLRPELARESDLTRLIRTLLQALKREVLSNTSLTVSVDYDDTVLDGLNVVALAQVPSVVLSAPRIVENRFYSTNALKEEIVQGPTGPEIQRRRPPYTADLAFTITLTTDRTVGLLNLTSAVARFLNQNRWVEMLRDPDDVAAGTVRWEMDPEGDFHARIDGPGDVRVYACGFVVRGFDLDEGLPLDRGRLVTDPHLATAPLAPGGSS